MNPALNKRKKKLLIDKSRSKYFFKIKMPFLLIYQQHPDSFFFSWLPLSILIVVPEVSFFLFVASPGVLFFLLTIWYISTISAIIINHIINPPTPPHPKENNT